MRRLPRLAVSAPSGRAAAGKTAIGGIRSAIAKGEGDFKTAAVQGWRLGCDTVLRRHPIEAEVPSAVGICRCDRSAVMTGAVID